MYRGTTNGITILYQLQRVDLAHLEIFHAKVGKDGIMVFMAMSSKEGLGEPSQMSLLCLHTQSKDVDEDKI